MIDLVFESRPVLVSSTADSGRPLRSFLTVDRAP